MVERQTGEIFPLSNPFTSLDWPPPEAFYAPAPIFIQPLFQPQWTRCLELSINTKEVLSGLKLQREVFQNVICVCVCIFVFVFASLFQ